MKTLQREAEREQRRARFKKSVSLETRNKHTKEHFGWNKKSFKEIFHFLLSPFHIQAFELCRDGGNG